MASEFSALPGSGWIVQPLVNNEMATDEQAVIREQQTTKHQEAEGRVASGSDQQPGNTRTIFLH
jgi:hypothetical protein